jgi:hypothetical protein
MSRCHDGIDGDWDGLTDCRDPECDAFCGEDTVVACRNGVDDDESGLADCDDPSCLGLCAEETPAQCADHIDEDGDTLVDLADPSCWPAATTTFERCASQSGGDWIASFDGSGDEGWFVRSGTTEYVVDAAGRFSHEVLRVPEIGPAGESATLFNGALVTGSIEGLRATVSILLASASTNVLVQLLSPSAPPHGAPSEIAVVAGVGGIEAWSVVDAVPTAAEQSFPSPLAAGWYDIVISLDATTLRAEVLAPDGTSRGLLTTPHAPMLSSAAALQLAVSHTRGGGGLLGAAEIRRDPVNPCGEDVVVPSASPALRAAGRLIAGASSGDAICAITLVGRSAVGHRSEDRGRTFQPGDGIAGSVGAGPARNPCATLAWDPERELFAGLVWTFEGDTADFGYLVTSSDCATWTVDRLPSLDGWPVCADYSLVASRTGGAAVHELWASDVSDGELTLQRQWSEGALTPDVAPRADEPFVVSGFAGEHAVVRAAGGDLIVGWGGDGELRLTVIDRALLLAREWTAFGPSRIEGSCDAATLGFPALFFDGAGSTTGGVAHSCGTGGIFTSEMSTVVRTFAITP